MEIRNFEREKQPLFGLDIPLRSAIAAYCKARWPAHTAKSAAREWGEDRRQGVAGLSLDEARGVVSGRASLNALETILKHPNGGWAVAIPAFEAVIGHGVADFLTQEQARLRSEQQRNADNAARLAGMARDLPAVLGLGSRRLAGPAGDRDGGVRDLGRRKVLGRN